jgi:hypothetical protein
MVLLLMPTPRTCSVDSTSSSDFTSKLPFSTAVPCSGQQQQQEKVRNCMQEAARSVYKTIPNTASRCSGR